MFGRIKNKQKYDTPKVGEKVELALVCGKRVVES